MKTQNYRYLLCMAVALLAACSDAGKGKESEEGVQPSCQVKAMK